MQALLPGPGPTSVRLIHEDRSGKLWVATQARGVFVIDAGVTRHLGVADGLPGDWVLAIHEDERGVDKEGDDAGLADLSGEVEDGLVAVAGWELQGRDGVIDEHRAQGERLVECRG